MGRIKARQKVNFKLLYIFKGKSGNFEKQKQPVVARSITEAEFRSMAHGICELLWLKSLFIELIMINDNPPKLYCDYKATISIAYNCVQHDKRKHVEVNKHSIKEKLGGLICAIFFPIEKQLADVLTKGQQTILVYH